MTPRFHQSSSDAAAVLRHSRPPPSLPRRPTLLPRAYRARPPPISHARLHAVHAPSQSTTRARPLASLRRRAHAAPPPPSLSAHAAAPPTAPSPSLSSSSSLSSNSPHHENPAAAAAGVGSDYRLSLPGLTQDTLFRDNFSFWCPEITKLDITFIPSRPAGGPVQKPDPSDFRACLAREDCGASDAQASYTRQSIFGERGQFPNK